MRCAVPHVLLELGDWARCAVPHVLLGDCVLCWGTLEAECRKDAAEADSCNPSNSALLTVMLNDFVLRRSLLGR